MGVYESRGALDKAMKDLTIRWNEARSQWDDAVAREFEEKHLKPLLIDLRTATAAMDQMAALLNVIHSECS